MQKLVYVFATAAALLWSMPVSADPVPHFFEGIWGTTERDCADPEGPNFRLTVNLSTRVGKKILALADRYEDHCIINDVGIDEKANVAGAELVCYRSWQDLRVRKNGHKTEEAWVLDRGVLHARGQRYRQCDGDRFAIVPDPRITVSPVNVPTCSRAGCEGTMVNISGQDTDQATATITVSDAQAARYCREYEMVTRGSKLASCIKRQRAEMDETPISAHCSKVTMLVGTNAYRYQAIDGEKRWLFDGQEQAPSSNISANSWFAALCPYETKRRAIRR